MRAGKLDRKITIQEKIVTQTESGEPVETWSDIVEVWAQVKPNRGDERFGVMQNVGKAVVTFHMRWLSNVSVLNRVIYDEKIWDILDVREIGRNVGLEIDCTARADA